MSSPVPASCNSKPAYSWRRTRRRRADVQKHLHAFPLPAQCSAEKTYRFFELFLLRSLNYYDCNSRDLAVDIRDGEVVRDPVAGIYSGWKSRRNLNVRRFARRKHALKMRLNQIGNRAQNLT